MKGKVSIHGRINIESLDAIFLGTTFIGMRSPCTRAIGSLSLDTGLSTSWAKLIDYNAHTLAYTQTICYL